MASDQGQQGGKLSEKNFGLQIKRLQNCHLNNL